MPTPKADQAIKLKRIEQAYTAILDGNTVNSVKAALMAEHNISESQAYKYVKEAMDKIYEKSSRKFEQEFEKHYKRLERLYAMCIKTNDRRTANQVLKQMSDLFGLDAPKRTDITTGGDKIATFVDVLGTVNKPKQPEETKDAETSEE